MEERETRRQKQFAAIKARYEIRAAQVMVFVKEYLAKRDLGHVQFSVSIQNEYLHVDFEDITGIMIDLDIVPDDMVLDQARQAVRTCMIGSAIVRRLRRHLKKKALALGVEYEEIFAMQEAYHDLVS